MKPNQIKKLFEANMVQLNKLHTKAGSAVKAVLMAAETNGPVYVRLLTPDRDSIEYDIVEGNQEVLQRVGQSLGVTVTETQFVVETKLATERVPLATERVPLATEKTSNLRKRGKLNVELEQSTE